MALFNFDELKEKAGDLAQKGKELAQSGAAKSKELAEIGKLKLDNAGEEDTIRKAYIELGKLYYAERGMTPDAAYAAQCEKITAAKAVIEANTARIEAIRADNGEEEEPVPAEVVEVVDAEAEAPAETPEAE